MAHVNNIFAALLAFLVSGGMLYLVYNPVVDWLGLLPGPLFVALGAVFSFIILGSGFVVFQMLVTDDKGG